MKKFLIILIILLVLIGITVTYYVSKNKLHSTKQIEDEVSKYSFNYSLLDIDEGGTSIGGWNEYQKDWYFHDNDLDFDFYATSQIFGIENSRQLFVGYWRSYINKAIEVLGDDFRKIIKDTFAKEFNVSDVEFKYLNDISAFSIELYGNKTENYSEENWDNMIKQASNKICDTIKNYDPNFENRKLNAGWFTEDKNLCFKWYNEYNQSRFYHLLEDSVSSDRE